MAYLRQLLGQRVRERRMALGEMSLTKLAEATQIPIQVLSRLENGHQTIYVERLAELAQALGVSADYLLGLTDDPTPPKRARRGKPADEEEAA